MGSARLCSNNANSSAVSKGRAWVMLVAMGSTSSRCAKFHPTPHARFMAWDTRPSGGRLDVTYGRTGLATLAVSSLRQQSLHAIPQQCRLHLSGRHGRADVQAHAA